MTVRTTVSQEELLSFAHARLAGYKRPRSVAIVEQLPKSAAGKILRRKVRDQLATDFSPEA